MKTISLIITALVLTLGLALYTDSRPSQERVESPIEPEIELILFQVKGKVKRSLHLLYQGLFT